VFAESCRLSAEKLSLCIPDISLSNNVVLTCTLLHNPVSGVSFVVGMIGRLLVFISEDKINRVRSSLA